jgi:hypothetical protein
LDAEATYYGHRAIQEEQTRGPGYRPGRDGATVPDRKRSDVMSARDPATRRRRRVLALTRWEQADLPQLR